VEKADISTAFLLLVRKWPKANIDASFDRLISTAEQRGCDDGAQRALSRPLRPILGLW